MKNLFRILFFFLLVTQICFAQWYQQTSGTTANLNSVHFIDANIGWAVGDSGIIIKTTNGGVTWVKKVSGTNKRLNSVYFIDGYFGWAVGESEMTLESLILKTTNGGEHWLSQNCDVNKLRSVFFTDSNNGWAVGYGWEGGNIIYTTNGGQYWNRRTYPGAECYSVQFVDNNVGWVVGVLNDSAAIFNTTDNGITWTKLSQGRLENYLLSDICFTNSDTGTIVGRVNGIGTGCGGGGIILTTTNSGNNWTEIQVDKVISISLINKINIWVTGYSYAWIGGHCLSQRIIKKSTDAGITWPEEFVSTTDNLLADVKFVDENNGWAVGDNGTILHTSNGGVTFIDEEQIEEMPTEFLFSQNYPNPFNSSSVIKYSIPKSSQVTLKIFNTLGEELETLVNEEKPVGTYEVNWNAANLPSGVYFYRLQAGSFVQTRKMILLK
jgi:photosystem II stability/assembly factor-like uncharacterized protein